jgi:hypothetical protein
MGLAAFPNAMPIDEYVRRTYSSVTPYGFAMGNSLAMVGRCRDELTDRLAEPLRERWGPPFNMGCMAGMLFLGRAGLWAAQNHAPGEDGRQRYVIYAMPHIGIDEHGVVGRYRRPGQQEPTAACGALVGFQRELADGTINVDLDPYDLEASLLRQRLLRALQYGHVPDIRELTEVTRDVILADLVETSTRMRTWAHTDVAVFSGIQVHTPDGDYVDPGRSFVRIGEQRTEQELTL